jgi:hypothetical protein
MKEMNLPPEEFQARLTQLGGLNLYDEPNFRIWWSQYGHGDGSFRSGGCWTVDEASFTGYRSLLRGSGEPCYTLGQWNPPEVYGSPEQWYVTNLDAATGLQILGEFPYSGRVEVLYNLRWNEIINGRINFYTLPLNTTTFDLIIPVIIAAKSVSYEKRRAALAEAKRREEAERMNEIERHLRSNADPFGPNAVSFTRQGIRSTVVDAKMLQLRNAWSQLSATARTLRPGIQTR